MDSNVVECEVAERDGGCICSTMCREGSPPSLDIINQVQRVYEEKLNQIERHGGSNKLEMQASVLRFWVNDLVGQNQLLVRAVEELEADAVARVQLERRRHLEALCELRMERAALRRRLARKDSDIRGLIEVLRRLRESDRCTLDGIHFFEVTESDIFGSLWRQKKLEQGDSEVKYGSSMLKDYRLKDYTKSNDKYYRL